MSSNEESIKALLNAYRDALVSSSVPDVIKLYAPDGVVMPPTFQTQIGHDAVETWYNKCFEAITLTVTFGIKEVIVVSDEYAFARTTSAGTQKQNATGKTSEEGNQELFVLKKVEGEWKIARYCFCITNRRKAARELLSCKRVCYILNTWPTLLLWF